MYSITEQQIDFILNDIRRNGVELEDLQYNLLDHVCCIIEQELEENGDFEQFYHTTIRKFYKERLGELEDETLSLLTFKHYYTMKKLMIGSGILMAVLLSFGIIFKFNYWPGASALISAGILLLSLVFLPLYFTLKLKEEKHTRDKVLVGLTSVVCISICLAILFKVMHWPGANVLGLVALGVLVLLFLPIYFITGIRNPDTKVNTIVASVLIIAGAGLFLTLARSPKGTEVQQTTIMSSLVRSEMILQSESRMLKSVAKKDSSTSQKLGEEITALCEDMKTTIVQAETGCTSLLTDYGCKAKLMNDGMVRDYFSGEHSMMPKLELLNTKIKVYNEQLTQGNLTKIPESVIQPNRSETTIPGCVQSLIQIEMFVLQNERALLANN